MHDEPLAEYRAKRDFERTSEPAGELAKPSAEPRFVVQKHAASRLHYDFRLEVGGVLASWAVPKGPSLRPQDRRLAVRVEDHPLDYAGFEGTIPQGEYGGGAVIVWDSGTFEYMPEVSSGSSAAEALSRGKIGFRLNGQKLRGAWLLLRTGDSQNWLLIKRKDNEARPDVDITVAEPRSVKSGRTVEQVAAEGQATGSA